ncbi:hypothetical protein [Oceanirhabdus seepicola]|uniref:Uncharacterized protein n=1 Tax=Oceanirhabdus seepicola TaxID=2828781 RepID=A0A9J6P4J8_9CLOT|nr:hypothetical protein [Oceanirhabdus seepicola]MCM1991017.1 hypothetical protein [Oceanirhabdus seepicola]
MSTNSAAYNAAFLFDALDKELTKDCSGFKEFHKSIMEIVRYPTVSDNVSKV